MFGDDLINARQLAKALNISNTTLFKLLKRQNSAGEKCPVHQLAPDCRKYYRLEEVRQWLG